jgi:hypothetical protein
MKSPDAVQKGGLQLFWPRWTDGGWVRSERGASPAAVLRKRGTTIAAKCSQGSKAEPILVTQLMD